MFVIVKALYGLRTSALVEEETRKEVSTENERFVGNFQAKVSTKS
jgi:hypothetical protein